MDERAEILAVLRENARYSVADIAQMTDCEESTVESVVAELEGDGVVRGYRAVVDWSNAERSRVTAMVELNVTLDRETNYRDIADRIVKYPPVDSLRLVSGDFDFAAEVSAESMEEVSRFVSDEIAPIPEVTQTVTHYVMETYKEHGIAFGDGDDDDRLSISP
ncbi:MAG: Lrp/AsnC family transcriptional regulator [Halococcoides sp.]